VSEKHANFVVNNGDGKAQDVVMLASLIKQKVRTELGVQLVEEIQYVGF
jgi:UDP-N-acetylmuramate dehydrogenase